MRLPVNGCDYFYTDEGDGPETVVFGHGYLMTHRLFAPQIAALKDRYRCIAFDWRGQGESEVTEDGYDVPNLTTDLIHLLDQLGVERCHYVGLSMGGFVGYRLALRQPELLQSLALLDTDAGAEPKSKLLKYNALLYAVRYVGWDAVINRVMPILFGRAFMKDEAREDERARWKEIITSNDRTGAYHAGKGIFSRNSVMDRIDGIKTPTLLLVGEDDVATVPEQSKKAHERMPNSELVIVPDAGHSSSAEEPEAVTEALEVFITKHSAAA